MSESFELDHQGSSLSALSAVKMLWKRKGLASCIWLGFTALAVWFVHGLPSIYKADAIVLVDSQKIPDTLVSSTVTGDVADRLALLSQSVMTSSRLLEVARRYNLYPEIRDRSNPELLLRRMRKDISVSFEKNWTGDRNKAFRLSFEGPNPQTTADVANRLAGLYVAENMRVRKEQAKDAVDFLDTQLVAAKRSLDEQEAKVAAFKQRYNGTLPEQETSLLSALSSANIEIQGISTDIARAQENSVSLQGSLSAAESTALSLRRLLQRSSQGLVGAELGLKKSDAIAEKLRQLKLKYTNSFPEVQRLEEELSQARKEEAKSLEISSSPTTDATKQEDLSSPELLQQIERISSLRAQIEVTKRQIEALEVRRTQVASNIADLQTKVGKLPLVEQEMSNIKRNYDESAANYNSLLQKQMAAGMATDMESSQKSERFHVVDPARVPQTPDKPKRALLAAVGSFVGLALALLATLVVELRNRTILGEWELPKDSVILGRVPQIKSVSTAKTIAVIG
jgi:polysaccharide biosynthesis transport protein